MRNATLGRIGSTLAMVAAALRNVTASEFKASKPRPYRGMTKEQREWNEAVDAKKAAKKAAKKGR